MLNKPMEIANAIKGLIRGSSSSSFVQFAVFYLHSQRFENIIEGKKHVGV